MEKGTKRIVEAHLLVKLADIYGVQVGELEHATEGPIDHAEVSAPSQKGEISKGVGLALDGNLRGETRSLHGQREREAESGQTPHMFLNTWLGVWRAARHHKRSKGGSIEAEVVGD